MFLKLAFPLHLIIVTGCCCGNVNSNQVNRSNALRALGNYFDYAAIAVGCNEKSAKDYATAIASPEQPKQNEEAIQMLLASASDNAQVYRQGINSRYTYLRDLLPEALKKDFKELHLKALSMVDNWQEQADSKRLSALREEIKKVRYRIEVDLL